MSAQLFLNMEVEGIQNAPEWGSLRCEKLPLLSENLANLAKKGGHAVIFRMKGVYIVIERLNNYHYHE